MHLDVDLACCSVLGGIDIRSGLGDVIVEEKSDEISLVAENIRHGILGTAAATIVDVDDFDLVGRRVRLVSISCGRGSQSNAKEECNESGCTHDDWWQDLFEIERTKGFG